MRRKLIKTSAIFLLFGLSILSQAASAQTTAFSYQGRLTDGGNGASGSFQMLFKLFDSLAGPTQIGSTLTNVPVTVTQGIFSVKLDFGSNALNGANRWLEIAVRRNSGESYVTLSPREQIASSPYAVRTLSAASADNALNLGGVAASQFIQTNDARLSDARNPLPNSANYIQNGTDQQASSHFHISGNGTLGGTLNANVVRAETKFNIGADQVLSTGSLQSQNLFAGRLAGQVNTTGSENAFFGTAAGFNNTTGRDNSFFGTSSGLSNSAGVGNSFVGSHTGTGSTGNFNSFLGAYSGGANSTGSNNTAVGYASTFYQGNLTNATAIGSRAAVSQSNSLVLGSILGFNDAPASTNVGIGTMAPKTALHIAGGNIYLSSPSRGVIITSPNGTCYQVRVTDAGVLYADFLPCP